MQFPTITPPTPAPLIEQIAENLFAHLSPEVERRKAIHRSLYQGFWDSPETPDAILAEMASHVVTLTDGTTTTRAKLMLQMAGENVDSLARIAAFIGCELNDLLPESEWMPRRAFVVQEDATVTLAPAAEGYDAWGNLIPLPEPEPDPEPDPE